MTDERTSLAIDAPADPQGVSYTPDAPEPKAETKLSPREAIEKAAADLEKDGTKIGEPEDKEPPKVEDKKPEPKAKEQPAEKQVDEPSADDAKADEAKEGAERDGKQIDPSEGRDYDKPPAQFLTRAKEKWLEADPDIRSEVKRMESEFQKGKAEFEEDRLFRKELRQFEDMARDAGTNVRAALENYTAIDKLLRENPTAGVERILQSIGISPEQYANHVLGQAQQQQANPALAHTQRLEQQLAQMTQQIQQLTQGTEQQREAARYAEVERTVIAPFVAEHPRYQELEQDIAFFLNSGKISSNLSERDRLEEAYYMAERLNPASGGSNRAAETRTPQTRPLNPAGAKSVKGSPAPGLKAGANGSYSAKESIAAAMDQIGF